MIMNTPELSALMIQEMTRALCAGTLHIRKSDNKILTTHKEIIEALLDEGGVELLPPS